jgi:hypothetical protein
MRRVFPRVAILTCVVSTVAVSVALLIGCGGVSPFSAARFAGLMSPIETAGNGGTGTSQPAQPGTGAITSVCDIDATLRVLSVTVANASAQFLQFSMTFAVSAGPGGFVCDSEVQNYTQAGYTDALVPGSGNTITIGCDTLTLLSGNRLLTMEFGVNQGAAATLGPAENPDSGSPTPTTFQLVRRDNGSPLIPLPELIVLGNSDVNFLCTGQNLCTQRGFLYTSAAGIPVGKPVDASRIQGTVCQTGFGTAPEWRLDKTVFSGPPAAYQYAAGGAIVATALNRANDSLTETRKQVVWLVADSTGQTIHFPAP